MIPAKYIESQQLILVTWSDIAADEPCEIHKTRRRPSLVAVQAEGQWGNANVQLLGSLSNVSFTAATTALQQPIDFSANATATIVEPYLFWQPKISGNVETSVTVTLAYW
jgi:type 1 fimbria pilin